MRTFFSGVIDRGKKTPEKHQDIISTFSLRIKPNWLFSHWKYSFVIICLFDFFSTTQNMELFFCNLSKISNVFFFWLLLNYDIYRLFCTFTGYFAHLQVVFIVNLTTTKHSTKFYSENSSPELTFYAVESSCVVVIWIRFAFNWLPRVFSIFT